MPQSQLKLITLEDGKSIYIEATDDVSAPESHTESTNFDKYDPESSRNTRNASETIAAGLSSMENTIRSFTNTTLGAFKEISDANINKVTLEFGVKIGGEAGIPYVTKGTAESNVKITVECSFPKEYDEKLYRNQETTN